MAENHPVGFQWVMEARERGAEVIHVDPRFTRTSAMATQYVADPARHRHRLPRRHHQLHPRATTAGSTSTSGHYTNAPVMIDERFRDTEDLDGVFSGFDARRTTLRPGLAGSTRTCRSTVRPAAAWAPRRAAGSRRPTRSRAREKAAQARMLEHGAAAARRSDARSIRAACFSCSSGTTRATRRRWSSAICGTPREQFLRGREDAVRQLRPRAHERHRLFGRLDAAHGRRAVHPRRLDRAAPAGQHRPSRRRHPRACAGTRRSKARPTSRRSTNCCRATSRCRRPRRRT